MCWVWVVWDSMPGFLGSGFASDAQGYGWLLHFQGGVQAGEMCEGACLERSQQVDRRQVPEEISSDPDLTTLRTLKSY